MITVSKVVIISQLIYQITISVLYKNVLQAKKVLESSTKCLKFSKKIKIKKRHRLLMEQCSNDVPKYPR